ncbi:hypothetical protein V5799_020099 [Amblyomma americanum]|uniref:Uncharacterized protein n=1 Tax=Amblyomma americanum TaxID=6943 RepID=A0AAQ4EV13_AMBAM
MARPNEEQCWVCLLVTNEGCTETVSEKGNLSAFSLVPPRKKAGVHWSALFDFKSGTMLRSEAFVKKGVVCGCLSSVSRRQWSAWSTEAAATKDGADVTVVDKHVRDVINTLRICYKKKWQS